MHLLVAGLLLPLAAAAAPPRARMVAGRAPLEVRAALRATRVETAAAATVQHALRELPPTIERPGAYARVTRWIEDVVVPGADGKPKLVVVSVRGGLGLGWARRW